jgi:hypothetical protein
MNYFTCNGWCSSHFSVVVFHKTAWSGIPTIVVPLSAMSISSY